MSSQDYADAEVASEAPSLPRRIGVNAIFLEPRMGGLDTYVRALVPELARLAGDQSGFTVYCSNGGREYLGAQPGFDGVDLVVPPLIARRGLKAAGELTLLGAIAGASVDLLHSVAMTAPLWTRAVSVVTLADVTWIRAPDPGEASTARLWRLVVPPAARRADRVITLSRAAAEDIVRYLRVPPERIDVVPLASGGGVPNWTPEAQLRSRLGLGSGPVILSVSAKKIHKNLERLIRAMALVLEEHPSARLVIPGNPTAHERELRGLARGLTIADSVIFPDYVGAADLEGLYRLSSCFVFPSINEGFGIPILEAMRRGLPVACARASALPEVAGDAARYFDPYDVADIAAALLELLGDRALAGELAERGRRRESQFTWEATAAGTLASYARAFASTRQRMGPGVAS